MAFSSHFAQRAQFMRPSAIRKILSRTVEPGFISFTAGKPSPRWFPVEEVYAQSGHVLEKYGAEAMQYASTWGFQPLREWVARRQPPATADNVLMVAGSQQAIDLTAKLFLDPGDKVALSAPTYTTAMSTLGLYGVEFLPVASDEEGMLLEPLEAALQQSPKLLYCIPNFMNPTGVNMTLERRQALIALARKYNVPILEDDPYGELRFEGEALPNLFELAPEQVIYASTFSKTLAPGFRLGWIIANQEVLEPLMIAKQIADLQVPTYSQRLIYEIVQNGFMDAQIPRLRDHYRQQRDLLLDAMQRHFPPEVSYHPPSGGMFVWCELPEELDATELLEIALEHKVAYIPGASFYPNEQGKNTFRLSYSIATPEEIEIGIEKLGKIFRMALNQ